MEHYNARYIPNGTQEILVATEACFDAVEWGTSTEYIFTAPFDGVIHGVRLVHKSGSVSCQWSRYTLWGCNNHMNVMMLRIIDKETLYGEMLYPLENLTNHTWDYGGAADGRADKCILDHGCDNWSYRMDPYMDNQETEFIWNNPIHNVSKDDMFMLVYGQSCCGYTVHNNDGISCAEVWFLYDKIYDENDTVLEMSTTEISGVYSDSNYNLIFVCVILLVLLLF